MWIIQTAHPDNRKVSMYYQEMEDSETALFTMDEMKARKFEREEAKQFIKDNELTECHVIPI